MRRMLLYRIPCVFLGLVLFSLSAGNVRADAPAISSDRHLLSWTSYAGETDASYDGKRSRRHSGARWRWEDDREFIVRYNRVEGPFIAWRLPHAYDRYRETHDFGLYSEVGYGLKSTDWRYQIGVEFSTFRGTSYLLRLGAELHDFTDTEDTWIIPEWENSLAAFLFKKDHRDFYRRTGWSAYLTQRFGDVMRLTGRFRSDDLESLEKQTDWSLFGGGNFRENPAVDEGRVNSVQVELRIDTRDAEVHHSEPQARISLVQDLLKLPRIRVALQRLRGGGLTQTHDSANPFAVNGREMTAMLSGEENCAGCAQPNFGDDQAEKYAYHAEHDSLPYGAHHGSLLRHKWEQRQETRGKINGVERRYAR